MASSTIPRGIIRDLIIIAIGIFIVWIGLYAVFGMSNPFYVVASGSMIPELEVYDILIVQANIPFEELRVGDIIVFDRPSDHSRVIVHRIVSVVDEDPRILRTKGDANMASIPGTDFPVTDDEYIGKVEAVIPDVGYVTQALKPPVNYIIIAVIIGVMVSKQFMGRKRKGDGDKTVFFGTAESDDVDGGDGGTDTTKDDGEDAGQPSAGRSPEQDMPDVADDVQEDPEYITDEMGENHNTSDKGGNDDKPHT